MADAADFASYEDSIANNPGQATLPGGASDMAKMQPFSQDPNIPWSVAGIMYGFTKALDNSLGVPSVLGNTDPGFFAGANGRTYAQNPQGNGGGAAPIGTSMQGIFGAPSSSLLSSPLVPLVLVALAAYFVLKK